MANQGLNKSHIGQVAEGWKEVILSDAVNINPERRIKKGGMAKFVAMADLQEYNKKIQSHILREFRGGSKFKNGDTLMARITPCLENGKTAYVDILGAGEAAGGSTEFIVLSGKDGKTENQFVYYLVRSPEVRAKAIQAMTGTSGRQRVESTAFNKIVINLPPISRQKTIAKVLGDLDEKIDINHQMSKMLESMGKATFKRWFIDFEFPDVKERPYKSSGGKMVDSELGEIPEGWDVKTIGELADIVGGTTPSTKVASFWDNGQNNWVTPKDLSSLKTPVLLSTERSVTDAGLAEIGSGLLPVGTVLLSSRAPIGYLAIAEIPVAINQGFIAMKPRPGISSVFLLLWCHFAKDDILSRANGSTFLEISKSSFRPIPVVVPTAKVLEAFRRIVAPFYERIVVNEWESLNLSAQRDLLLPKLMSGEITGS